jgi:hypothetical protein
VLRVACAVHLDPRMRFVWLIGLSLVACAQTGVPEADDSEQQPDMEQDDDDLPTPPGGMQCEEGFHACGESCLAPQRNEPDRGCAQGCGQACAVPQNAVATCTDEGTCDFTCPAPYARVNDACVLLACDDAGYTCGTYTVGGSSIECGTCFGDVACGANHQCNIAPDFQENNNTVAKANSLGDLDDSEDPASWLDGLSIHSATDEDWYRFHITDGFDFGNPDATIQLADHDSTLGWLASTHELTVWFKCDSEDYGSSVKCGEWYTQSDENSLEDPALGIGCTANAQNVVWGDVAPSCTGTTDSGTVTVRVKKRGAPRGDTYDLYYAVD